MLYIELDRRARELREERAVRVDNYCRLIASFYLVDRGLWHRLPVCAVERLEVFDWNIDTVLLQND
jgi:hypothetical protein